MSCRSRRGSPRRGFAGVLLILGGWATTSPALVPPVATPVDSALRCLRFLSPTPGAMIVDPVCTVKVESRCSGEPVDVVLVLPSPDRSTTEILPVGRAVSPNYTVPWSTVSIPNLLFDGAELQARSVGLDSTVSSAYVKGISVFHGVLSVPRFRIPYDRTFILPRKKSQISLFSPDSAVSARATASWASDSIFFSIDVTDPHLESSDSSEMLSRIGVEILLDPHFSRGAFPSQREFVAAIPVHGRPFRIMYSAQAGASGSFAITTTTQELPSGFRCLPGRDGYSVEARIPTSLLRDVRPDSLGFNLIVKYLRSPTSIGEISWVPARGNDAYSPCLWGRLVMGPRVRFEEAALLFGLAFIVGCGLAVLIGLPFAKPKSRMPRSQRPGRFTPAEARDAAAIIADIEAHVTERGTTLKTVCSRLSLNPGRAAGSLRKYTGRSFSDILVATRLEVAKERLRSCRTSEAFIAESSGFSDAQEMLRAFKKHCRTTPEQFRREFNVA